MTGMPVHLLKNFARVPLPAAGGPSMQHTLGLAMFLLRCCSNKFAWNPAVSAMRVISLTLRIFTGRRSRAMVFPSKVNSARAVNQKWDAPKNSMKFWARVGQIIQGS